MDTVVTGLSKDTFPGLSIFAAQVFYLTDKIKHVQEILEALLKELPGKTDLFLARAENSAERFYSISSQIMIESKQ